MAKEPVWNERFRVRATEIGPNGRLRLPALCDWLQETAGNHAVHLDFGTDHLLEQGLTWVLSRLTLRARTLPLWRSEATVATWPSGVHRIFALRDYRVTDGDGAEIARATSAWLVVKVDGKRPVRPPAEVVRFAAFAPARAVEDTFEPLPEAPPGATGPSFRVGRYDLDLNSHANNVAILRWLLESLPCDAGDGPGLVVEAEFRGECFLGDRLAARVVEASPGTFHHALFREGDGREVARARTVLATSSV
jgi:medium-chain acyl-[acyl-carrier-protein] hydrolase